MPDITKNQIEDVERDLFDAFEEAERMIMDKYGVDPEEDAPVMLQTLTNAHAHFVAGSLVSAPEHLEKEAFGEAFMSIIQGYAKMREAMRTRSVLEVIAAAGATQEAEGKTKQ